MKKIFGLATTTVAATIALAQAPATTTSAPAAAPAQTTTATASDAAPAATKPWSVSFKMLADVDAGESRTLNAEIATENTIGMKYKLTPKDTVMVESIFYMVKTGNNTDQAVKEEVSRFPVQGSQLGIGYRRSMDAALFGAKFAPGIKLTKFEDSAVVDFTASQFSSQIQLDNNLSWTLSPLVSMDFYVQARAYNRGGAVAGRGQATASRFLEALTVSLNPNDTVSVYQALGLLHGFDDGLAFRETRQRLYSETGMSWAPAAVKGLSLGANINADMTYSSRLSSVQRHTGGLYEDGPSNDVLYELTAGYTF